MLYAMKKNKIDIALATASFFIVILEIPLYGMNRDGNELITIYILSIVHFIIYLFCRKVKLKVSSILNWLFALGYGLLIVSAYFILK